MKKNISVNIFGTLYPIDEDAYELLQQYNQNMRSYYSRREGGDEIADDVEHRVAELLTELRSQGVMAITIEHVKEIINRIGDPQQMDEAEEQVYSNTNASGENDNRSNFSSDTNNNANEQSGTTPPPPPPYEEPVDKKLFRDPEDRILGGVLSGVAHYFGIKEPLLLRIITVLLGLLSLSTIAILYVIAWILIPEATTPEDRLRMYGKPVNAKSLNEELLKGVNSASNFVSNPKNQDTARGCLSAILKFFLICIAGFACFILGAILLSILAAVTGIGFVSILAPVSIGISEIDSFQSLISSMPLWLIIVTVVSGLLLVGIPLYAIIRAVFSSDKKSMASSVKTGLIILWLASLAVLIGSSVAMLKIGHDQYTKIEKERNTHNGVFLMPGSWKLLEENGWEIVELQGSKPWIDEWGTSHKSDNEQFISLKAKDNPNELKYDLQQSRNLKPGKYIIEGWVNADGEGNALYVILPDGNKVTVDIPAHVDTDNIVEADTTNAADSGIVIDSRDNGQRMWTHVEKEFEVTQEGNVTYGISNSPVYAFSPWSCSEVSISGVNLKKAEN